MDHVNSYNADTVLVGSHWLDRDGYQLTVLETGTMGARVHVDGTSNDYTFGWSAFAYMTPVPDDQFVDWDDISDTDVDDESV